MRDRSAMLVATWFGSGLIPPLFFRGMAGTYGSLAALPLCYGAIQAGRIDFLLFYAIFMAMFVIGHWSIPIAETLLGPRTDWKGKTRRQDQNEIVIDEVVGMLVACVPFLYFSFESPFLATGVAFAAFRFFDIVKPPPADLFEHIKTANGVLLDDVCAGAWAAIVLILVHKVFGL